MSARQRERESANNYQWENRKRETSKHEQLEKRNGKNRKRKREMTRWKWEIGGNGKLVEMGNWWK